MQWASTFRADALSLRQLYSCSYYTREAELVKEGLPRKELKKVRRMLTEYGLSGWDMTYVFQADNHNLL